MLPIWNEYNQNQKPSNWSNVSQPQLELDAEHDLGVTATGEVIQPGCRGRSIGKVIQISGKLGMIPPGAVGAIPVDADGIFLKRAGATDLERVIQLGD